MILCMTLNAAIDKTVEVDGFKLNAIHRPSSVLMLPGGKGCNVGRALQTMGVNAMVSGLVGGHAGNFIDSGLQREGLRTAFAHTPFESRTCLSILDRQASTLTEIYEKGESIPAQAQSELLQIYQRLLPESELVILSGSLPQGLPVDFYARLLHMARAAGVGAFLDSSGEPLRLGVEQGRPNLVKPNRHELQSLLPGDFSTPAQYAGAARELAQRFELLVAISLGIEGLVYSDGKKAWWALPPSIKAVSAVGSGDCLLAGLAIGHSRTYPVEEMLRLATAMGSANALSLGAGRLKPEDVEAIRAAVQVFSV